jgi:hypothetical protein
MKLRTALAGVFGLTIFWVPAVWLLRAVHPQHPGLADVMLLVFMYGQIEAL